ncbi:hypothetical protein [Formosa sp. S-31]|uniref:hypothetical protein n=1 Tax=Formosa sp. S-31 TaxID=2790949 RepID=UPI003EBBD20C
MNISSLFSNIKRPPINNKKIFGVVTIAIIIISLLGLGYYLYIKDNESNITNYKFTTLDNYFKIASKKLENDFLRQNSIKEGLNEVDNKKSLDSTFQDSIYQSTAKKLLKYKGFDHLIIRITDNRITDSTKTILINSIALPKKLDKNDSLFGIMGLEIAKVADLNFIGQDYKVFARKYNYSNKYDENVDFQMIGLIKSNHYKDLTRQLDPWIICLLATFLLLCVFGMPFFKMYFIAEDERLNRQDIVFAGFAILIGSPLLYIIFLSIIDYSNQLYNKIPSELEHLACNVKMNFEEENKSIITRLYNFDLNSYDKKYEDSLANDNFKAILNSNSKIKLKKYLSPLLDTMPKSKNYFNSYKEYFKIVSKIDTAGTIKYSINYIKEPPQKKTPTSLSHRNYFKNIKSQSNVWTTGKYKIKYVMRPVVSIQDETEEAVYIIQNDANSYKVGSSQLKSVHQPILPFGYKFAIVDSEGEIWFHSDKGKSTLENLFEFSSKHEPLYAAIIGRIKVHGNFELYGEKQIYYTLPIEDTNLSLVAYYDISLLRLKTAEILSLSTMGIFCMFLLTSIITVVILIFRKQKNGFYKENTFIFDFLLPKKFYKKRYIGLSILLFALGLLVIINTIYVESITHTPSSPPISNFILILWSFLLVYYVLKLYKQKKTKINIQVLFLISGIVILNFLYFKYTRQNFLFLVLIQLFFIIILLFKPLLRRFSLVVNTVERKTQLLYQKWYAIFLTSWLLISSLLPAFLLYSKSVNIENFIWTKTNQYYKASQYIKNDKYLRDKLPPYEGKNNERLYKQYLEASEYNLHNSNKIKPVNEDNERHYDTEFSNFLWYVRPIFNKKIRPHQALAFNGANDKSWSSNEYNDSIKFITKHNKTSLVSIIKKKSNEENNCKNSYNHILPFYSNTFFKSVKIIGILILLFSIFFLIYFYVYRFFGFCFMSLKSNDFDTNQNKNYSKKFAQILNKEGANSGLIIIGPPLTSKRKYAETILSQTEEKKGVALSFLNINQIGSTNSNIQHYFDTLFTGFISHPYINNKKKGWQEEFNYFILDHLEYDIHSFFSNKIKLEILCYLIAKNKRIILISEIYPSQILSFYQEQINSNTPMDISDMKISKIEIFNEFNSWRNIIGAFPQVILGITKNKKKVRNILKNENDDSKKNIIVEELGYSNFLPELAAVIYSKTNYTKNNKILDKHHMIVHIQNLSFGYYSDIWNSMPSKERYMIYDLAQDDFLNIKNHDSLFSLIKKGLIKWDDRPVIFNQSFKYFILSSVSKEEALQLEIKNRTDGSWGTIKIVIYLIILTIMVFIALGEPNLVQDFNALITALGGLGVLLPTLSTILAKSGSKTT